MRPQNYLIVALSIVCVLGIEGCNGCNGPVTTNIAPMVITMAKVQTKGIMPENCNDWLSPSWKTPQEWWNGLQPTQPPRVVGEGVVGFELQFDTRPGGECTKYRQDLYRPGFAYSLAGQNLKGLVKTATIDFSTVVLPAGVSATGLCQPVTGGGGSLLILRPGETFPAAPSGFADLGSANAAASYPASAKVFGMTFPWAPGQITQGVQTGVTVNTQPSGTGGASFAVDVTSYLNGALNRGDTSMSFMLSGSDEVPVAVFPAGAIDCKTVYRFGNLTIEHY